MRTAYIALGSNLAGPAGSPEQTLLLAVERLEALGKLVGRSSLYSTAPVGYDNQPRFVNAVVSLVTPMSARELLTTLLEIELEFGRDRSKLHHNGPRTLDLDLLMLGDLRRIEPGLEIPHPRMNERLFVLEPLCEIAPQQIVPMTGLSVCQLLRKLKSETVQPIDAISRCASELWNPLHAVS